MTLAGVWSHAVPVYALLGAIGLATEDIVFAELETVVAGALVEARALAIDAGHFADRLTNIGG